METTAQGSLTPSPRLLETLARTLRHEVGDLLQTVYSTVAILQDRLPSEQKLERRLLQDLRMRAEICRNELDAVHDLVCPVNLSLSSLDLTELVSGLLTPLSGRFTSLKIQHDAPGPLPLVGDARRLAQVGNLVILSACQTARSNVRVRTAPGPEGNQVEWSITDDSPGATAEQLQWLAAPFSTTHHALFGLGVALARRVVELHGGRVTAGNLPEGGCRVTLVLPTSPPEQGAT